MAPQVRVANSDGEAPVTALLDQLNRADVDEQDDAAQAKKSQTSLIVVECVQVHSVYSSDSSCTSERLLLGNVEPGVRLPVAFVTNDLRGDLRRTPPSPTSPADRLKPFLTLSVDVLVSAKLASPMRAVTDVVVAAACDNDSDARPVESLFATGARPFSSMSFSPIAI